MAADRRKRQAARQAQRQCAFPAHGVRCVDRHVDERRLELAPVRTDVARRVRGLRHDANARAHHGVDHVGHAAKRIANVEHLGIEGLPPGEGEQLAGELGGSVDRVGDRLHVACAALVRQVRALQEVGGRLKDREQVVEVVRDAAGQLSKGLKLLRLPHDLLRVPKLRFGQEARADVVGVVEGSHDLPRVVAQGRVGNLPARLAELGPPECGLDLEGLPGQGPRHVRPHDDGLFGDEEVGEHVTELRQEAVDPEELVVMGLVEGDEAELGSKTQIGAASDWTMFV